MTLNPTCSAPRLRRQAPRSPLSLLLPLLVPLLLPALLLGAAPRAWADGCSKCEAPTLSDLRNEPGFKLERRESPWGDSAEDYYQVDGGECVATADGLPNIQRLRTWLVLRGSGEVWDCPHSKSVDTVTITASESDSTSWSLRATVGVEMSAPGAKVKASIESGQTTGVTITEVTTVSKTITPGYCSRIGWKGYFEVGEFQATATFTYKQRWAWWTKNDWTGAAVHASGDMWVPCGSDSIALRRKAPLSGYFYLSQTGCEAAECRYVLDKQLGFFPKLPADMETPALDVNPSDDDDDDDEPVPSSSLPSSGELGEPPAGGLPNPLGGE